MSRGENILGRSGDFGGNTAAHEPLLRINANQLKGAVEKLDPGGSGVAHIPRALDQPTLACLQHEVDGIPWRNADDEFENSRRVRIKQYFDAFGLKLLQGDQQFIEELPYAQAVIQDTQDLVRGLAVLYPTLERWEADEVAFHRYRRGEMGLSMHKDSLRHPGLIATLSLSGVAKFEYKAPDGRPNWVSVSAGDLVLMRAPGLHNLDEQEDSRPEHAVTTVYSAERVSMTIRANTRPDEQSPRAEYYNWRQA